MKKGRGRDLIKREENLQRGVSMKGRCVGGERGGFMKVHEERKRIRRKHLYGKERGHEVKLLFDMISSFRLSVAN